MEAPENISFAALVDLKWSVIAANRSHRLLPTVRKAETTAPIEFIFPGKRKFSMFMPLGHIGGVRE